MTERIWNFGIIFVFLRKITQAENFHKPQFNILLKASDYEYV